MMKLKFILAGVLLFISACSSFEEGERVVVISDYDDYRPGYISGKYVGSSGDSIDVEIRKFNNVSASYFDDLEKGDEGSFPKGEVYSKADSKEILSARKKFFKEIDKIEKAMKGLSHLNKMSGRNVFTPKVLKKVKVIKASKIKVNESRIETLIELASNGQLKDWQAVIPMLQLYLEMEEQSAKGLDEKMQKLNNGKEQFEALRVKLAETLQTMPYSDGEHQSNSFILAFIYRLNSVMFYPQFASMLYEVRKPKTIEDYKQTVEVRLAIKSLDHQTDESWVDMVRNYSEELADKREAILDNSDDEKEQKAVRVSVAREYLATALKLSLFKKSEEQALADVRNNLEALGVSFDDLGDEFETHLETLFGRYQKMKNLSKGNWQGTMRFRPRSWSRKMQTVKVKLKPLKIKLSQNRTAEKMSLEADGKLKGTGKNAGKNYIIHMMTLGKDWDFKFDVTPEKNARVRWTYLCNMSDDSQSINCDSGRDKKVLTLGLDDGQDDGEL